jgi:hypothetical protein
MRTEELLNRDDVAAFTNARICKVEVHCKHWMALGKMVLFDIDCKFVMELDLNLWVQFPKWKNNV